LSLGAAAYDRLAKDRPDVAVGIMRRMLAITAGRLLDTGSFLTQMVQWGESARKRAVTDEATGLFNRRFLDDSLESLYSKAAVERKPFAVAMFDLDHFGDLNRAHGQAFGDEVIVAASGAMRRAFREGDILVRYGGDEFTFVMPGADGTKALELCRGLCREIRAIEFPKKPEVRISASVGAASYPEHAADLEALKAAADKALYHAKEMGRDRAVVPPSTPSLGGKRGEPKRELHSLAERNRIIHDILAALEERDGFVLVGHHNPDEDCIASMVAFGLLASKMGKRVAIVTGRNVHEQFEYLLTICAYNSIRLTTDGSDLDFPVRVVAVFDTPKPTMVEAGPAVMAFMDDPAVLRVEVDHHLQGDAAYSGDEGYNLVTETSSAAELVGFLAFKMDQDRAYMERNHIDDAFSRNFVLAVLTGMIGDSRMGKYIKSQRERWHYEWFSALFERMLVQKTRKDTSNFTSKEEVFQALMALSGDEERCHGRMMSAIRKTTSVHYVLLDESEATALRDEFGDEVMASVSKSVADMLAERSGKLGLVAFPDPPAVSSLVQFRLRRAQGYSGLDLREVLSAFSIENGGGHQGAIGFRFEKAEVPDFLTFAEDLVHRIDTLVASKG